MKVKAGKIYVIREPGLTFSIYTWPKQLPEVDLDLWKEPRTYTRNEAAFALRTAKARVLAGLCHITQCQVMGLNS